MRVIDAIRCALALATTMAIPHAHAHGDGKHAKPRVYEAADAEQKSFGTAGDPVKVTRTIRVDMHDTMKFAPGRIHVRQGDTVRFIVRNRGQAMHEMVIGSRDELEQHAALMRKFPNMEHEEPYMAHVPPGASEEIVWTFNRAGEFEYGCLVAGHFEAGMWGTIMVDGSATAHRGNRGTRHAGAPRAPTTPVTHKRKGQQ